MHSPSHILIVLSCLVLLSYLFNQAAGWLRIPSVLLLIATGIGLQFLGKYLGYNFEDADVKFLLQILGTVGLVFIVLEGALDLQLTRKRIPLIGKSFASASLILLATSGIICWILIETLGLELRQAIVYAVPLGIISSAAAIPSVTKLMRSKREFITYESTFSDVLGIMLFNYIVREELLSFGAVSDFFLGILYMLLISAACTGLLLLLLNYTTSHVKFFLIFAFIILIYSISEMIELPSLMFVLIFGLMLNNARIYIRGRLANYLHVERLSTVTTEMKMLTAETAFLVRTFFFLLFGYTIRITLLSDLDVLLVGSLILLTILLTRFIFLRFISRTNVIPEIFIAPRGLITIILFYSIPAALKAPEFNEGILLFVILGSSLLMMLGTMLSGKKYPLEPDELQSE